MSMPQSPRRKISLKELFSAADSVLTEDHPNPNREGCPEHAVLERLAEFSVEDSPVESDVLLHIAHCDPCFKELLRLRSLGANSP